MRFDELSETETNLPQFSPLIQFDLKCGCGDEADNKIWTYTKKVSDSIPGTRITVGKTPTAYMVFEPQGDMSGMKHDAISTSLFINQHLPHIDNHFEGRGWQLGNNYRKLNEAFPSW